MRIWIEEMFAEVPTVERGCITVPFYSDDDPAVFVLDQTRTHEMVVVLIRGEAGTDQWQVAARVSSSARPEWFQHVGRRIFDQRMFRVNCDRGEGD
ncbi:MAG: hypothetical protein JNN08_27190 [Bryobacterales bacterium]|nr:hypothetical protein [Bryobacterales bacterium]